MQVANPIIPIKPIEVSTNQSSKLDLEAICIFAAIGFFIDEDTYWKNKKILKPASNYQIDSDNKLIESSSYFKWHYSPREISFNDALEEFTVLFETIVKEQTQDKRVILPLSGGLDSRTLAAALNHLQADVYAYSYEFSNGYAETKIASQIAEVCGFDFKSFAIKKGYLWNKIDELLLAHQPRIIQSRYKLEM